MKMIAGLFFSASSKAFLRFPSASPAILDIISGPLIKKKKAPVQLATALAIRVFPDPGGPQSKTPRGGLTPNVLKSWGCLSGNSIISLIAAICFLHPPISSQPTSSSFSSSSLLMGSPSVQSIVLGATIPYSLGSVATILNSTGLKLPLTMKRSPFLAGRQASLKQGMRQVLVRSPAMP